MASVREIELPCGTLKIEQDTEIENEAGCVVWDSALVLIHYLAQLAEQQQQQSTQQQQPWRPPIRGARVLELGAGTGAVGLAAAALGARRVLLTDRPHLIAGLRRNIGANGALCGAAAPAAEAYEWGAPLAPLSTAAAQSGGNSASECQWDLLLLSDLVYDPESLGPLVETLAALLGPPARRPAGSRGSAGGGDSTQPAAPHSNGGPPPPSDRGSNDPLSHHRAAALVAVELRTDTGVAQFVRALVGRGYLVERIAEAELHPDWRDDDIWLFMVAP